MGRLLFGMTGDVHTDTCALPFVLQGEYVTNVQKKNI